MRTRSALLLCLMALAGMLLSRLLGGFVPAALRVWLGGASSIAFFALPAAIGLCGIDGDQRHLLPGRRLSGAQALWLLSSGALLVCPMTLLSDVIAAIIVRLASAFGAGAAAVVQGADGMSLFMPMLLVSGVIAPVCEELFFRGYLLGALGRYGVPRASVATALLFAAAHGLGADMPVYALMGLLFAVCVLHTGSVLASVLVHMAYNVTLVLLAATPASLLFTGLTPAGCLVRLLGCAALSFTAQRAWRARGTRDGQADLPLTRREWALLAAALLLVIAAQATAMLAAGGNA